jgi:hypothetical protein
LKTNYLKFMAVAVPFIMLSGCGGHGSSKDIISNIESYKAELGTINSCVKEIEGARKLVDDAEDTYKSRAFMKYVDSARNEIRRTELLCEKYERFKGEGTGSADDLEKMSSSIIDHIQSLLTVIENGINQQESYKAIKH